ncbi:MAG TPA: hypothetical protein VFE76_11690, partial [Myxococcales bacterium]|nr:hypothetical protein [Myxococcales bacterium]
GTGWSRAAGGLAGGSAQEVSVTAHESRDPVNTDAFGPYLEFVDCVLRPSAHPGQAPLLREVFGSSFPGSRAVTPVLPLLRRLGERAGNALALRARAVR